MQPSARLRTKGLTQELNDATIRIMLTHSTLLIREPLVSRRAVAGKAGDFAEDCSKLSHVHRAFSYIESKFRRRRPCRAAQGDAVRRGSPGRPFLWLLSLGRARESDQLPVCHRDKSITPSPPPTPSTLSADIHATARPIPPRAAARSHRARLFPDRSAITPTGTPGCS